MSLKTWVLSGMNRVFARPDLPSRDATTHANDVARVEPMLRGAVMRAGQGQVEHLGRYGPLIGAIREELEEFVASHVRLHLAIAERDRYLLTSIGVESTGSEETRELLDRFRREFAPEQVRHFLAKEVVARLPNANAIDLSQFAGIDETRDPDEVDAGAYDELMDELHRGAHADALGQRRRLAHHQLGVGDAVDLVDVGRLAVMLADIGDAGAELLGEHDLVDVFVVGLAGAGVRPKTVGENAEFHGNPCAA